MDKQKAIETLEKRRTDVEEIIKSLIKEVKK